VHKASIASWNYVHGYKYMIKRNYKMDENKIIYACIEHIEIALDDYINEKENAPNMQKCEDKTCSYCSDKAIYKLTE